MTTNTNTPAGKRKVDMGALGRTAVAAFLTSILVSYLFDSAGWNTGTGHTVARFVMWLVCCFSLDWLLNRLLAKLARHDGA